MLYKTFQSLVLKINLVEHKFLQLVKIISNYHGKYCDGYYLLNLHNLELEYVHPSLADMHFVSSDTDFSIN